MKRTKLLMVFLTLFLPLSSWADDITSEYAMLLIGSNSYEPADKLPDSGMSDDEHSTARTAITNELSADELAASDWFSEKYGKVRNAFNTAYLGTVITTSQLGTTTLNPNVTKVLWVHVSKQQSIDGLNDDAAALKDYVKGGGNLLLTGYATQLLNKIDRTKYDDNIDFGPNLVGNDSRDNIAGITPQINSTIGNGGYDHQHHPIFKGLTSETSENLRYNLLSSAPSRHQHSKWDFNGNFNRSGGTLNLEDNPNKLIVFEARTNSIVLGAWEHVLDAACAGLIEFLPVNDFKGRIIANGMDGYEWDNDNQVNSNVSGYNNIQLLTKNCMDYLAKKKLKQVAYLLPVNIGTAGETVDKAEALAAVDQDDEKAALNWFYEDLIDNNNDKGVVLCPRDLADLDPTAVSTMWIHIDRDEIGRPAATGIDGYGELDQKNIYHLLQRYVKNGGNLLLTKQAVCFVGPEVSNATENLIDRVKRGDGPNLNATQNDLAKDNPDDWAINPVIGAGAVSPNQETYTNSEYKYNSDHADLAYANSNASGAWPTKDGNKYVSYYWTTDNNYATQMRNTGQTDAGDIWDYRDHHLYYKMDSNTSLGTDGYPLNAADGFGVIKYEVLNIVGGGYREDHNTIWEYQMDGTNIGTNEWIRAFQRNNKADALGQWAQKTQLDNAAIVDFKPCLVSEVGSDKTTKTSNFNKAENWKDNAWEGHILCIGLGAYEWQMNDKDDKTKPAATNPYLPNIKQMTYNALNVLENDMGNSATKEIKVGGVTYIAYSPEGGGYYATILETDGTVQIYDLVGTTGSKVLNGQVEDPDDSSIKYDITNIGLNAFANSKNLAYADLTEFKGLPLSTIRSSFPQHTLLYLAKDATATSLDQCAVTGTNIINTLSDDSKVCKELKIYDNEPGSSDTEGWNYYWWANKYEFTAVDASFDRTFIANQRSTVALPFPIPAAKIGDFGTFYRFDRITDDNRVRFLPAYGTEAYKPYMIVPKGGEISMENVNVTIPTMDYNNYGEGNGISFDSGTQKYSMSQTLWKPYFDENTWFVDNFSSYPYGDRKGEFIACYREKVISTPKSKGVYIYKDGKYGTSASNNIYLDPYRGHIQLETPAASARALEIIFEDDDVTGITNLHVNSADADCYYTLSGVRVTKPTRGIYVKNGKKVIIK